MNRSEKLGNVVHLHGLYNEMKEDISDGMSFLNFRDKYSSKIANMYNTDLLRINKLDEKRNVFEEAENIYGAYDDKIINYIAAILDPEFNYNTGIMVKQPSFINPPSVSIPIKTLTTVNSSGFNSMCIAWNPTLFCTSKDIKKLKLGANKSGDVMADRVCSTTYSLGSIKGTSLDTLPESWNAPVFGIPDNLPDIGVSKARLVSAKIKISFRGSRLNQGGSILGCATFQGVPGIVAKADEQGQLWTGSQKPVTWEDLFRVTLGTSFDHNDPCPFEQKIISNGIWAKNVNITENADGITAVYIPVDPMDEIFYKPGTFYGEDIVATTSTIDGDYFTTALTSSKGAKLSYLFNIQGLSTASENPITIETYQTWEIIPTSQAASAFRNTAPITSEERDTVHRAMADYMDTYLPFHTSKKLGSKPIKGIVSDLLSKYPKVKQKYEAIKEGFKEGYRKAFS